MVRHIWPSNSAKVDSIKLLKLLETIGYHVPSALKKLPAAPIESSEVKFEVSEWFSQCCEYLDCCLGNIHTSSIAWNAIDPVNPGDFTGV